MDLKAAQDVFISVMQQLTQIEAQKAFLSWVDETWIRGAPPLHLLSQNLTPPLHPGPQLEFNGSDGKLHCDPLHTLHVDAFLYDEDMVDELCDTGELARNYCVDCSSHNTQPITYISHSISRERLAYVFRALLPPLPEEATLLDIGSRLGAVLYGAYVYTKCKRIIGIELNGDLCQVQQIIQVGIWRLLRTNTKKGSLLVTIPSLQDSLRYLDVGFRLEEWVREVNPHDPNITAPFDFQTETSEVKLYQIQFCIRITCDFTSTNMLILSCVAIL
ncbi:hypothetical protein Anas_06251 [Armadillidium nasatum]|uniref:DOT1 domain-containing protein n=1 Tax=Armadillidium nasatum TaxID=96803 RepID=A0A5N5ST41_9CRUS|nr:hypothetical protein Anas_06251 [Armadillidium nasatum]